MAINFLNTVAVDDNVLFVDTTNDRVGIGTDSPERLLHVNSSGQTDIHLTSSSQGVSSADGMTVFLDSSGSGGLWLRESKALRFATSATEQMRITSDGNVGINTTLPDFKLDVDGTFGVSDLPFNTDSVSVLVADETIGAELVTNGDFATDTDWTKQNSGSTISGGKLNQASVPNGQNVYQTTSIVVGNTYKATFTISNYTSGSIRILFGSTGTTEAKNANGTFTVTGVADGNTTLYIQANGTTTLSVDNISIKEVTSASNQIQKRELGTGAFGPTPVGAYLPLTGGTLTGGLAGTSASFNSTLNVQGVTTLANVGYLGDGLGSVQYTLQSANNGYATIDFGDVADANIGRLSYSHVDNSFLIKTNNATALTLDSSQNAIFTGNVGIGATIPNAKLHVVDGISGQTYSNVSGALIDVNGTSNSYSALRVGSSTGNNHLVVTNAGNVGIGTTIPNAKLDVSNGASGNVASFKSGATSSGDYAGITLHTQTNSSVDWYGSELRSINTAGTPGFLNPRLGFFTQNNSTYLPADRTEKMSILGNGNVGIGTTSPGEKLDVNGNIKIKNALLSNQENTDIDSAAAEVVAQVAHATYTAAFFDFVVKKGTNVRSGTVYACHDGDTTPLVEFTETSTQDLGDTSDVVLSVDISGANMRLLATVASDDWSVKSLVKAI